MKIVDVAKSLHPSLCPHFSFGHNPDDDNAETLCDLFIFPCGDAKFFYRFPVDIDPCTLGDWATCPLNKE